MILDQNRERHSNIDTKTPLYSSRILASYLEFIKKYYPDFDIDSALKYTGTTRYEVEDAGHWFNQEQTDRFHEILAAKTGNPNAEGLPEWPRYQETSDQNIVLDADIRVESNYLKKNLDTLERVYKAIGKYN